MDKNDECGNCKNAKEKSEREGFTSDVCPSSYNIVTECMKVHEGNVVDCREVIYVKMKMIIC